MPKKHLKEKRLDALELLSYGQSVSTVHYATGIPLRTLYNWQAKLKQKHDRQMAQKNSQIAAKPPQEPDSCHIPAASRQLASDTRHIDSTTDRHLPNDCHSDEPSGIIVPPEKDAPEEQDQTDTDYEDFTYIRDQLMTYARQMAADLRPDDSDSNRRTLALSRILDRIQWLDQILPDRIPEKTIRFEYYYDGQVQEHPPWHGARERYDQSKSREHPPPKVAGT